MSQQFDNNMSGALFPNKNKESGDKRPHYTGNVTIGGQKYSLAGWKKVSKNNQPYMSLKASEWRDDRQGGSSRSRQPEPEFDDDIPF